MKQFLIPLAAPLLASPLAAQAALQPLDDDSLSAVHAQGFYTLRAGELDLYTLDTTTIGAHSVRGVEFSTVYQAAYSRAPGVIDTAKDTALETTNAALVPVTVSLRAQFATIPFVGEALAARYTPVKVEYSPTVPGAGG
ncbi:MAG: hypothetical protein SVO96_03045 [Pseudomonadota bacterium]|nr:hypothetical protein [Pseudomonadota bacterium]